MFNVYEYCEKLARLIVKYSIEVKEGDRVLVSGPVLSKELILALKIEILKAGGHPLLFPKLEGEDEIYYRYASDKQLEYYDDIFLTIVRDFDSFVNILTDYNTKRLALVDPEKIGRSSRAAKMLKANEIFQEREMKGEIKWTVIPFPCNSNAQEANMDLFSYSEFVWKALLLDKEDPVEEWRKIQKKQDQIINQLEGVKIIQVLGEDTDLTLSTEGRTWRNSSGQRNLPDGEIYTSPVENAVNGHIRFTFPGFYQGKEIENIYLEFEKGVVVKSTAEKGQDLLDEILKIENADKIGEFAIGTNYGIQKFTKNMLFDEKMGGTIHCALGMGFQVVGSKNVSTIHWDMLKDMRVPGSKILADGKLVYEEGKWKI